MIPDNLNRKELTICFNVIDENRKPISKAFVVMKDSGSETQITSASTNGSSGTIDVLLSGSKATRFQSCKGIDLYFAEGSDSGVDPERPVLVQNRVGLYCEGRDSKDLIHLTQVNRETRILRRALPPLSSDEMELFGSKRKERLTELLVTKSRIVWVVGESGLGKTAVVRQAVQNGLVARPNCRFIYCASFESDNSSRAFAESFAPWLANVVGKKLSYPLTIEQIRDMMCYADPITLVIDGIDEFSDSGHDRNYGNALKTLLLELVKGKDAMAKHGAVLTARNVPYSFMYMPDPGTKVIRIGRDRELSTDGTD